MKSLLVSTSEQEKLIQNETERRRTLRLLQTRQIEKQRAAQLRHTVANEKKKQTFLLINQLKEEWVQQKTELHDNLEYQFRENLMEMGKGHKEAAEQPDYEHQWLQKTVENESKASERGQQALEKLHFDQMHNENDRNLHLLHRKAALELEKIRAQRIAKLPPPEDPIRDLQTKPTTIVTVHDPNNFTTSRYHLEERLVTKEEAEGQVDAAEEAIIEQERVDAFVMDKQRLWNEQQEKARVRGDSALKREVLDNAYDNVLNDLSKLERQDRDRRQKEIQNLPKSIFIPPWRREEEREEKQRQMETAFEQVYEENHRKEPIPIVLMNEDEIPDEDEEANASDRTLVAIDEEKAQPEYRMATITPSANTKPEVDEMHDDEEATLADPTLMTLQTPAPDGQVFKQQQQQDNMKRLMEKIERQRIAAQQRNQHQTLITPTNKTPKKCIVSPGYDESGSTIDSSLARDENHRIDEEMSTRTSNTSIAEIEERRSELEARKNALEEQIHLLSQRANLLPQPMTTTTAMTGVMGSSSSSDISIESLLRNLRPQNHTGSVPSSASSIITGKHHEEEHEKFVQAVQAIVTTDESQLSSSSSSSSGIGVKDDERSHPSISDRSNRDKVFFDKFESHSSEDRDHSLEDLIARLLATQQQQQQQQNTMPMNLPMSTEMISSTGPMIIDDLVDDVLSSISSLSMNSSDDQSALSRDNLHQVLLQRTNEIVGEMSRQHHDSQHYYEEKRLIEQELELIRRERENLLNQTERSRQQQQSMLSSAPKTPQQHHPMYAPPPPPSLLRTRLNLMTPNEVHELSTIQEVDTPVSSRNTSMFHHRSPLKSSFDLQQLERISSADSSSSSSSIPERPASVHPLPLPPSQQLQQQQQITGLERDDSGISLIDGPRSSATSRTTLAGGNGSASGTGGGKSSSSGIQSLIATVRQPRVRTITNETTTTTNTSISANMPMVITTPRSTDSDDQSISSVSKKWRDILANECLPQLPQLTHSLGFSASQIEQLPTTSATATSIATTMTTTTTQSPMQNFVASMTTGRTSSNEEQILREQYENDQCDLMSLMKVHEYLTKQQPTTTSTFSTMNLLNDPFQPPSSSSSTPPLHHQSYSTLTSVTYRSSLAKPQIFSGPPISTPSRTSLNSSPSEMLVQLQPSDEPDRRNSLMSDIHHLTHSPNTFETSITSQTSSIVSQKRQQQDTLSYLIEENQRAMQRLIGDHYPTPPIDSTAAGTTTFFSSASMRPVEYESGTLMTTLSDQQENIGNPAKTTLIETGSLSTLDIPSAILHADERGILDEPSMTLLSNSYRSLTTTTGQNPMTAGNTASGQSQSTQKMKKQCSSPLSTCNDKTSSCSTPSLSPIKNEIVIVHQRTNALQFMNEHRSPSLKSSTSSSLSRPSSAGAKDKVDDDSSLLSFERHEMSAGNATISTNNDQEDFRSLEQYLPLEKPKSTTTAAPSADTDWSYYITVSQQVKHDENKKVSTSSSSSSSSSSSDDNDDKISADGPREHIGGLGFFIDGQTPNEKSLTTTVEFPSLQTALQTHRADFLLTSQKRVEEIKNKDYSTISSQLKRPASSTNIPVRISTTTTSNVIETDPEERQRRARESKERSKRLYDQLAEVRQKKKFQETKQQAQAYRARMNAFQTSLDQKKKTNPNKKTSN